MQSQQQVASAPTVTEPPSWPGSSSPSTSSTGQPTEDAPQALSPLEQLDSWQQGGQEQPYTASSPTDSTGATTPRGTQVPPQQPFATTPSTSEQLPTQWGTGTSGTFTQPGFQSPLALLPYLSSDSQQGSGSTTSETQTQTPQQNTVREFVGELVKASENEVLLGQSGEAQLQLSVDPQTHVTLNGFSSVAEDIREGTQVRAAYTTDATTGQGRAVRLEATTQEDTTGTNASPQETQPSQ
ncbi:putative lipoprotein [Myxococcus stipitatus DSM 14675]|uniref:Putative lipoprotein n=2 Tax=Myxococcus stipitatus TaxID=83455 RepID=L7U1Y0_MYXSD|nr:putative lipoprotein [Myxococcus stipitatus DSM 14675]